MTGSWRTQRAPDGRIVEFLEAQWGKDDEHTPVDTIPVVITMAVDGAVLEWTIYLSTDELGEALGHGEQ